MKKMIFDSMVKNAVKWVLPFCLFAFFTFNCFCPGCSNRWQHPEVWLSQL